MFSHSTFDKYAKRMKHQIKNEVISVFRARSDYNKYFTEYSCGKVQYPKNLAI
jgi:hypothetical protein